MSRSVMGRELLFGFSLVLGMSLISCFVGFVLECVQRDITHLKYGIVPK